MIYFLAGFCLGIGLFLAVPEKPKRKHLNRFREPKNE